MKSSTAGAVLPDARPAVAPPASADFSGAVVPPARLSLDDKVRRLLSAALGCTVLVTVPPVPRPAARGAASFWVECFSEEDGGELRRVVPGQRPPGRGPAELRILGLSGREAEVLFWIAQGKTNPEIAVILGIGRRTVATHVEHLLAKLSVENRGAAARCAAEVLFG